MLIFKVMVCFLAVFTSEDYVGGLPSIQDPLDNHQAGQSARSASNQGVTNEPGNRPRELLDHAERHEEKVYRKVNREIKTVEINPSGISSVQSAGMKFENESTEKLVQFGRDMVRENEKNTRRDVSPEDSSSQKQSFDKSKSRNDQSMSSEFQATSSPETKETQRFSSLYARLEPRKKVDEQKLDFENNSVRTDDPGVTDKSETSKNFAGSLISETNVPVPEEESKDFESMENRQRKSLGNVVTWHQQSTNKRPTRTQHLVQNKRSPAEGTLLKLPGYGGTRNLAKAPRAVEVGAHGPNRRQFIADGSSSSSGGNQLQFPGLNPVQINAAIAYSNRQPSAAPPPGLNIDLSRALYQFGPAQLHALRGVFDKVPPSTQNFKPIAPKQVAYVPPRIVYEAKIVPTPFMPFRTEQKTVEALSALLGQNPAQQLQGLNLILRKDRPEEPKAELTSGPAASSEVSRQGVHEPVALSQAFVTPIPSIDINSGLGEGNSFTYSQDGENLNEEIEAEAGVPFNHKTPQYSIPETISTKENPYKTIPIVEEPEETQRGPQLVEKELHPVWESVQDIQETTGDENEGRYSQQNEEGQNHGVGYAAKYSFGYHVKDYESGNNFGHQEARDGIVTNGRYHVLLPDGRLQNVKYHVDENGYHAKVSYQMNPPA